ncbi:hypothetical protein BLNAU_5894 [Blattamonas nauphoetae]|uniref:Armadillo repeat-containing protein 8 n=1 Tax=Blattamonas nauphoetae TaxID=2049346 RepID=A0ABQ9Y5W2_9EUKA|nr:hypothetical protein BLNAU_5894 [Blattamonas nauphoetae]
MSGSIFEASTAIEQVVGNLKICLSRRDFPNLAFKCKCLISRYDNPLVVAYSEELDDEELIRLVLTIFQETDDSQIVSHLGDVIFILARRPKNLRKIVESNTLGILMEKFAKQDPSRVNFVTQILAIIITLLEYEDIRELAADAKIIESILPKLNNFIPDKKFIVNCLKIFNLLTSSEMLLERLFTSGAIPEIVRAMNNYGAEAEVCFEGCSVLNVMLDQPQAQQFLLENSITPVFARILNKHATDSKVPLPLCHALRKLIPFRRVRIEADQTTIAADLIRTITKHQTGNLTIVQYAFMTLVIMSTSAECRDNCRKACVDQCIVNCIERYSYNSAVVRDGCVALAALIYNNDLIERFEATGMAKSLNKAVKTLGDEDHKTTLRVLASAYKEASMNEKCIPSLVQHNSATSLLSLLNYQYSDKTIVALCLTALAKISANPGSHDQFERANAALVIPTVMSRFMEKNWMIVRSCALIMKNLSQSPRWKVLLASKGGYKQVLRAMVYYLKNCKAIILACLETIHQISSQEKVQSALKDERVMKALNVIEQRFHRKSRTIATLATESMNFISTKEVYSPDEESLLLPPLPAVEE